MAPPWPPRPAAPDQAPAAAAGVAPPPPPVHSAAPTSTSTTPSPSAPAGPGTFGPYVPAKAHVHIELPQAFAKLGLDNAILRALTEVHFVTPSEIQEKMIPIALAGADIIGQARTGTGKTAAFGLPIIQKLDPALGFQAIVVVPTRELAVQVEAELVRLAKHKPIRLALAYGGTRVSGNLKQMGRNPHIVVGTPGRILDLIERRVLPLDHMRFVVCDEVDRMFDIGFRDDIRRILSGCTAAHQTIFVSATINQDIERMVRQHMHEPQRIFTATPQEQLTNPEAAQFYAGVQPWDKQRALKMLMRSEKPALAIVFCRTKRSVDKVAAGLEHDGVNAEPIHGDLMQNKRERVMRGFRTGKINVLVATDLASRGIDVHEITHVINYDIPEDPEVYVHRVGRTARMGATGKAITFVSKGEAQLQTEIEKLINNLMEEYRIPGFIASPEPSSRLHHGEAPRSDGAAGQPGGAAAPAGQPAAPTAPQPGPDGYMPTSFTNTTPSKTVRPLGGKFPTRRRR